MSTPAMNVETFSPARHLSALRDLRPVWGAPLPPDDSSVAQHLDRWLKHDEPAVFVVMRGERVMALVVGEAIACGYRAAELHTPRGRIVHGLLDAVRQRFAGQRLELTVAAGSKPPGLTRRLVRHGFVPVLEQVHYRGELIDADLSAPSQFEYEAYAEAGSEVLLDVLQRIWGEAVSPAGRAPREELEEWLAAAEAPEGTGTGLWRLAYIDGDLAGVALAQLWSPTSGVGSMVYVGLVPERRGHGLGRALHQDALRLLKAADATTYLDSTEPDNGAMRRLLEQASCRLVDSSRIYAARESLPAGEITGPGSLIRMVQRLGVAVAALPEGDGARTLIARPGGRVEIDVRWSDAGFVDLRAASGDGDRLSLDCKGSLDAVAFRVALWRTARRVLLRPGRHASASTGTGATDGNGRQSRPGDARALLHAVPINAHAHRPKGTAAPALPDSGSPTSERFASAGDLAEGWPSDSIAVGIRGARLVDPPIPDTTTGV